MQPTSKQRQILIAILIVAFLLRLTYSMTQNPLASYDRFAGGDTWWYLEYGYRQVTDIHMEPLATAPLYLIFTGSIRRLFQAPATETRVLIAPVGGGLDIVSVAGKPSTLTVLAIWFLQAVMSTATCYFTYRIAKTISGNVRVGLIAAGALAFSLAMMISAATIMTETLYMFFLTAALMLYVDIANGDQPYTRPQFVMAGVGGLLGLATLTRAAVLLFPLGLIAHALLIVFINRRQHIQSWITLRGIAMMMVVYIALCSIWTGYYYVRWNEVVIGAKGLSAFFYLGTQGDWQGPEHTDSTLGATAANPISNQDYVDGAQVAIAANPAQYILNRVNNLLKTYAQPYGTATFSGESLKSLLSNWLDNPSFSSLIMLLRADAFLPKLLIYLTHYAGIGFGVIGIIFSLQRWRGSLAVIGFIAYVTLLHLALLALPRYLFPTLPFWWTFAALGIVRLWDMRPRRRSLSPTIAPDSPSKIPAS